MSKLTFNQIKSLQNQYGITEMQNHINNGMAWKFEGSVGRSAMAMLDSGACMLPKHTTSDYYGNTIPSRDILQKGSKGTFQNSQEFWECVVNGEIEIEVEHEEVV